MLISPSPVPSVDSDGMERDVVLNCFCSIGPTAGVNVLDSSPTQPNKLTTIQSQKNRIGSQFLSPVNPGPLDRIVCSTDSPNSVDSNVSLIPVDVQRSLQDAQHTPQYGTLVRGVCLLTPQNFQAVAPLMHQSLIALLTLVMDRS